MLFEILRGNGLQPADTRLQHAFLSFLLAEGTYPLSMYRALTGRATCDSALLLIGVLRMTLFQS